MPARPPDGRAAAIPRSWLFVPGDSPRKMRRAAASGADALILDLEDSVAPEARPAARAAVAAFLSEGAPRGPAVWVRVNALDTGITAQDVAALAGRDVAGFVLPKCAGPDHVEALARMIPPGAGILAIATETVRALRRLMREDWSHPRLTALTWGGEDLAADLGATANRGDGGRYLGPFLLARDVTLLAAAEAGVAAIDAVHPDFRDLAGLAAETREAASLGFAGKMAIHPAQIPVIHDALRPDAAEIAWAERVIAALEAAGGGVAQLDGHMLDRPHLRKARRILDRAGRG